MTAAPPTSALARRFAAALFAAAKARDATAAVGQGLQHLAQRLAAPAVRASALDPDSPSSTREQVLRKLTADAHELVRNLVGVVLARHREAVLPVLAAAYRVIQLEAAGEIDGELRCARALPDTELQHMAALADRLAGRKVHLRRVLQPDLIGGVQLRLGNTLFDASLATALAELRTHLLEVDLPG